MGGLSGAPIVPPPRCCSGVSGALGGKGATECVPYLMAVTNIQPHQIWAVLCHHREAFIGHQCTAIQRDALQPRGPLGQNSEASIRDLGAISYVYFCEEWAVHGQGMQASVRNVLAAADGDFGELMALLSNDANANISDFRSV